MTKTISRFYDILGKSWKKFKKIEIHAAKVPFKITSNRNNNENK